MRRKVYALIHLKRVAPLYLGVALMAFSKLSLSQLPNDNNLVTLMFGDEHHSYANKLSKKLVNNPPHFALTEINLNEQPSCDEVTRIVDQSNLVISIGYAGFEKALNCSSTTPLLATLLSKAMYDSLYEKHGKRSTALKRPIQVLLREQPISRQLNLVQIISEGKGMSTHLGVILGPSSVVHLPGLKKLARDSNISLHTVTMTQNEKPASAMQKILSECDLLLALQDPVVFNRKTVRGILLSSLKNGVPVIGYSKAYVNVGALVALYSSKTHYLRQTAQLAIEMSQSSKPMSSLHYPEEYSIAVNHRVAHMLATNVGTNEEIKSKMETL